MSMRWLVIIVGCVIWLTVRELLRLKRSVADALNSLPSSPYSQPTVRNPNSLADLEADKVQHDGKCQNCGVQASVPMSRTRLERHPWRIVWWCAVCGRQSRAACPPELVELFAGWDKPGGTSLSMREVAEMVLVDLDELNAAVQDEIL